MFEKDPFCHHSDETNAELFALPICFNLLVLPLVTREHHQSVLDFTTCCSVLPFTDVGFWRDITP